MNFYRYDSTVMSHFSSKVVMGGFHVMLGHA